MEILISILVFIAMLFIIALPLKMAAAALGAKRTGFVRCLIALIVASIMHSIGLGVPVIGTIVAFLLSCLVFSIILKTTFVRGIGISILHMIFSAIIIAVLTVVFGISLAGLTAMMGGVM